MTTLTELGRQELKRLLPQCTEKQQALFKRALGEIDTMREDRVESAITLCERTIALNLTRKTLTESEERFRKEFK